MLSLLYTSRPLVDDADRAAFLDDLQAASIARNSALDITGILITTPEHFAELIEGPDSNLGMVMVSILSEPRHRDVRILRKAVVTARLCSTWRMARFEGAGYGGGDVGRLIAAAHKGEDTAILGRLERLFKAIAFSHARAGP
ncbi:hypothetical protein B2G71_05680 [Novosphingobium sp. PC22D]|uniref:BLUF domain-containing protein n=1 Tax=Novosphingobium sp. PC22D TaxID=1962403 RepID=UPI000BF142C3|nr:BLUF domain-containing protein [Novosphingobium sp. PC22D]PEQ13801.1 hypothetical protein B2G71_05680 [Novosphingobium sp. PC22D]